MVGEMWYEKVDSGNREPRLVVYKFLDCQSHEGYCCFIHQLWAFAYVMGFWLCEK